MEIKTTKLSLFDGLELKEATFKKHVFPDHFHDAYSLGIIERGVEKVSFPGKNILVHAHSIIVINPYDIHANSFFDNDIWKYRIIYIGTDLMKYVQDKSGLFRNQAVNFPQYLLSDPFLYRQILNFHLGISSDKAASLHAIVNYLINHYAIGKGDAGVCKFKNEITDSAGYLQAHLYDKISIEQLAAKCAMDKFKFIRSFKKHTGLTPGSYLLLHRINKAKTLIAQNMPIVEVALETGFYDQSHFSHYFKKYIGIAPLLYKKGLSTE